MLNHLDQSIFFSINHANAEWLDHIMIVISAKWSWLPLYALLLYFIWRKYGLRTIEILLYIALLILACDKLSVAIKETIQRLRPCHDTELSSFVNAIDGCGGKFGFVSSHAANSMGLAVFVILLFSNVSSKYKWLLLLYALVIGYSRIYLGVHYPSDVIGGYLLGTILALSLYYIAKSRVKVIKS
jgi:undecaprenyl-diphosphatase